MASSICARSGSGKAPPSARLLGRDVDGGGLHHERQRDRPVAHAHHHRAVVIVQQPFDLHAVVLAEEVGPRERGAVHARIRHRAPRRPRIAYQRLRIDGDAQIGVAGRGVVVERFAAREGVEARADRLRGAVVDGGDALDGAAGVGADRQVVRGIEVGGGAGIGHGNIIPAFSGVAIAMARRRPPVPVGCHGAVARAVSGSRRKR